MTDPANPGRTLGVSEFDDDAESAEDRGRMSFLEHLDELRKRIIYSLYVLIACCVVSFFFWERLYRYYVTYFGSYGGELMYSQPMAGFMFSLKITGLVALIAAAPFMFSQLWLFVAPGLYAREKKVVIPFVVFSTLLFFGGAYFGHIQGFPAMWRFFASYEIPGLTYRPTLDMTFSFYVKVILGLGLVFQMPMLVFSLARFGIISAGFMLKHFKYAMLGIVVLAAVITPSGDIMTLAVFAAPMLVLYIVSIGVAWLFGKKKVTE